MTGPLRLANGCCRFGPAWLSALRPYLRQLPALAKEATSGKVHVPACTGLDRLLLADRIHVKEVQQFLQIAARALCSLFTHWRRHYDSRLTRNSEVSFGKSANKSSAWKNNCSTGTVSSRSIKKTFVEILSAAARCSHRGDFRTSLVIPFFTVPCRALHSQICPSRYACCMYARSPVLRCITGIAEPD